MDNWQKFEDRLRAVANDKQRKAPARVALITFKFVINGTKPLACTKPTREPVEFFGESRFLLNDVSPVQDWANVIEDLKNTKPSGRFVPYALIIRDRQPIGWLNLA